jgi:hypothetical protein
MRHTAPLLLSLLALLPRPVAAQIIPYQLDFDQPELSSDEVAGRPAIEVEPTYQEAEDASYGTAPFFQGDAPADDRIGIAAPADPGFANEEDGGDRFVASDRPRHRPGGAAYGPFRVVDAAHAALVGVTDERSPAEFSAMLHDHPGIATIELVDAPGTDDDRANLRLGRMIRAKGLATHVPDNGWVASGAVELFLAGTYRSAEPTARFAVHSWEDDSGRGPRDYSPDAPQNRAYLDYYRAMGMSEAGARAFYAMTNATPFSRPRELGAAEMTRWAHLADAPGQTGAARGRFAEATPRAADGQAYF